MAKTARITSIELFRFIAAIPIMLYHFFTVYIHGDGLVPFAFVFVEFFFMLSGFFMMKHLSERSETMSPPSYVFHKAASFYPIYIIAFAVQFVLFVLMNHLKSAAEVLGSLFHFKWEALLLQTAGFIQDPQFNSDYLLGQAWYLSAMLIAVMIAYPLAKYGKKLYLMFICPVAIIAIYSYIIQSLGTLNVGNEYFGILTSAILRGFAGTCVGSLCYVGYAFLKEHPLKQKKLAAFVEALCYLSLIGLFFLKDKFVSEQDGLFYVFVFFLLVIFSFTNRTPITVFLNTHGTKFQVYLGSLSLYLYLLHWSVISALQLWGADLSEAAALTVFLGITFAGSVLLKWFNDKRKSIVPVVVIVCVLLLVSVILPYGRLLG